MFDIGFWELALIAVVGLLVIGPERLPKVARTVGLWVGRMRGFVMSVKADIDKELRAEELKKLIDDQAHSSGVHEILEETRETFREVEKQDYLVKAVSPEKVKADIEQAVENAGVTKADSESAGRKDD
jgi:sec-independent protein translocase protein TatB